MSRVHDRPLAPPGPALLGFAALAMFVAALNLRPALAAVSPLVDAIRSDLGLSATGVALLTTIPTLAMGLFAPFAASVARRFGPRHGVALGLAVIAVGTAARGLGGAAWLQLSCAAAVGAGIAIAQTLLPAIVKARFAARPGLATGVYTAGLGLGGAIAAGVSAPLAATIGSWHGALASWSVLAVVGIAVWLTARPALGPDPATTTAGPATRGLPWRDRTAWRVTVLAAANSALYYCELAWVAALLHDDADRTAVDAGVLLTVLIAIQVVAMLAVPAILGEARDIRFGLTLTTAATALGFAGLALAPATLTWLWIVVLGIGHGGLFTLVLTVPVVISRDAAEAGRISAMAFFVGYACAALAPMLVGGLRDALGDFQLAFALLSGLAVATLLPISKLRPTGG
ncbi:CynX/NimT family MFS transporter [Stackebrandtia nassauensis]|uniref:Major facilitator superfamily MFS_1 n=1 Tax=Stackebrandtia nassauensis (strain DSM 44728 / CIP 108903 / NRRL B-16338 / NBRC 102104 / LLR-40K-21) TaxID=446470 RepID=D3Q328_STANL|nr:MFS transporter [Stackebrandtia nassauensis]ADD39998.1 major facilitator superfamily MFS_1 [Stackebrandtia nassauensis DSM 44728]